jgi:hypothetical protein
MQTLLPGLDLRFPTTKLSLKTVSFTPAGGDCLSQLLLTSDQPLLFITTLFKLPLSGLHLPSRLRHRCLQRLVLRLDCTKLTVTGNQPCAAAGGTDFKPAITRQPTAALCQQHETSREAWQQAAGRLKRIDNPSPPQQASLQPVGQRAAAGGPHIICRRFSSARGSGRLGCSRRISHTRIGQRRRNQPIKPANYTRSIQLKCWGLIKPINCQKANPTTGSLHSSCRF